MSTNGSGEFPQNPGDGQIQPHEGQPHHPTQPYPAQPYPGQPYPGQSYPGQPQYPVQAGQPGQYPPQYYTPNPNYDPNQQYDPHAPYLQQPVQQQYFAQPGAAPVNYIVQAQSLKGIRGWLLFFMICTGLGALGLGGQLPWVFEHGGVISQIFVPLLLVGSIAAVVTCAMELRIGKWVFIGLSIAWLAYNVTQTIDTANSLSYYSGSAATGTIILSAIFTGFLVLYFLTSKRVKETLVK